jgi:hypothetical protein
MGHGPSHVMMGDQLYLRADASGNTMMGDKLRLFDGHLLKEAYDWTADALCVTKACKAKKAAKEVAEKAEAAVVPQTSSLACNDMNCKDDGRTREKKTADTIADRVAHSLRTGNALADNYLRCDSSGSCMMGDKLFLRADAGGNTMMGDRLATKDNFKMNVGVAGMGNFGI